METIYRAVDGTEFYSKRECEEYEFKQKEFLGRIKALDECLDVLDLSRPELCDDIEFIKGNRDDLNAYAIETGMTLYVEKDGMYYYDYGKGEWLDIDERIEILTTKLEELKSAKEILERKGE